MKSDSAHLRKRSLLDRGSLKAKDGCTRYNHVTTITPPTITPRPSGSGYDHELLTWPEMIDAKSACLASRPQHEARRSSLFTSIKRIFKPTAKTVSDAKPLSVKRSKHEHANSEPFPPLHTLYQQPTPSPVHQSGPGPQRTVSATTPRTLTTSGHFSRPSTHAIEFPCSSKLKPLNLRTPLIAPASPASPRERRQSLPEIDTRSAAPRYAAPFSPIVEQSPELQYTKRLSELEDGERPRMGPRTFRRRSRSEGNLKRKSAEGNNVKKDEEIHGWREDVQNVVRHASELRNHGRKQSMTQPVQCPAEDSPLVMCSSTVTAAQDPSIDPQRKMPSGGHDMSTDLEDRVAKLEVGVQDFQEALRYLTGTDSIRIDPNSTHSLTRVPSILIHSLHIDGPRASVSEGTTMIADGRPRTASPRSNPSLQEKRPRSTSGGGKSHNTEGPPASAFLSLYEMMEDERSARMKLEHQVQDLQHDLAELKCHVTIKPTLGGYTTVDGRRHWATQRFSRTPDDLESQDSSESSSDGTSIHDVDDTMQIHEWHFDADDEIF